MGDRPWGFCLGSWATNITSSTPRLAQSPTASSPILGQEKQNVKESDGIITEADPAVIMPRNTSFLSLAVQSRSAPSTPPTSHFGTERESNLREQDRVGREPSLEQMIESLQVHMMNKSPRDPVSPVYNSHILFLLESFHVSQNKVRKAQEQLKEVVGEKKRNVDEFQAICAKWLEHEDKYKQEIKRLEHIIAKKLPDGLENVALARSNSIIKRGGRTDPDGKAIKERIRSLVNPDENVNADVGPNTGLSVSHHGVKVRHKECSEEDLEGLISPRNAHPEVQATASSEARSLNMLKKQIQRHGPVIEQSPRIFNPSHDFLISERLRHHLPVAVPDQTTDAILNRHARRGVRGPYRLIVKRGHSPSIVETNPNDLGLSVADISMADCSADSALSVLTRATDATTQEASVKREYHDTGANDEYTGVRDELLATSPTAGGMATEAEPAREQVQLIKYVFDADRSRNDTRKLEQMQEDHTARFSFAAAGNGKSFSIAEQEGIDICAGHESSRDIPSDGNDASESFENAGSSSESRSSLETVRKTPLKMGDPTPSKQSLDNELQDGCRDAKEPQKLSNMGGGTHSVAHCLPTPQPSLPSKTAYRYSIVEIEEVRPPMPFFTVRGRAKKKKNRRSKAKVEGVLRS